MSDPLVCLLDRMAAAGAVRFYAKRLAPNDNSKNQVYLGGDFSALNIIPHGPIGQDDSSRAGSVRDRAKAAVKFAWIDEEGLSPAPAAQLILYPKYPEVRMSGFLKGAVRAPGAVMACRDEGRVLFLGICPDGTVLGHAAAHDEAVAQALEARHQELPKAGIFLDLESVRTGDPRRRLLEKLAEVHARGWIASQKIGRTGRPEPYAARNGGGYTLEAELGISPNGYAEPDYLGWEVKQYGVTDFGSCRPKSPVTLMTPEPTGGFYRSAGVPAFLLRYGYPDVSGKEDRINFGGVYAVGRPAHERTGLRLVLSGYDADSGKITDMGGAIELLDAQDAVAASWSFSGVMEHWNRKHARAVYVPSMMRTPPPEYAYGGSVLLCEGTDVLLLLQAAASGNVWYDPGIKMEAASSEKPKIKRRSQFRVDVAGIGALYRAAALQALPQFTG